ncbi:MAG: EAL domain-containing protein, partial [Rhodoferax sp.]|nr:EAL domain-containing protein [Rhodoferax sp.]
SQPKRHRAQQRLLAEQEGVRQQAQAALAESEESLTITLHSIGDAVIATDIAGQVSRMNPTAERLTGWTLADALGRPLSEVFRIVNAVTREVVPNPVQRVMEHGQTVGLANHTVLLARDGQEYQIADSAAPIRNAAGAIVGVVLVFSDVTENYQLQESLHLTRISVDAASDAIFWITPDARIVDANAAACRSLGFSREELLQLSVPDVDVCFNAELWPKHFAELRVGRSLTFESEHRSQDGRCFPVEIVANYVKFGNQERDCAFVRDITARKASADKFEHLAFYDSLTDLPNRRLLLDRLQQALASSARHHHCGALMLLDMDDFKTLNDTLGHDVGDRFLVEVARRLQACVRVGDTAARQGGDEFVVILEDLKDDTLAAIQAESVAVKIQHAMRKPYLLDLSLAGDEHSTRRYHCSASIGITLFRDNSVSVDELMKRADTAMYQAKATGGDTLRFFDPEMQSVVIARAALDTDLREAVQEGQFLLYYQPQVDAAGRITGSEALVRWQHPRRGMVSPADFIPLAEATGLILPIGLWVLEAACTQLAAWAALPAMAHLTVAVNVSARQFRHPDFVDQVLAALDSTGADPSKLKLELTESLLLDNVQDIIEKMTALKTKGIGFSLDDFGTGYSSLAYLKRLPLDQLKIDQSFVRDALTDPNDAIIARTIVALAHSMGLAVIAEGVETLAQQEFLAASGCHAYQGYLFGRPMPAAQFEAHLKLG